MVPHFDAPKRRRTPATRLLALPPIATGLERDMVELGRVCPAASAVVRVAATDACVQNFPK
jgi:hypothetical protein